MAFQTVPEVKKDADIQASPMSLNMTDECWKIVLLKGLEDTSDYQFRMIKFLLASTLNLRKEMQEKYDKVQIANLMVDKFPLVNKIKSTPEKRTTPSEKSKQKEKGPATPAPERKRSTSTSLTSEGTEVTPGPQKRKNTAKGKDGTKRIKVSEEQTQPPCPAGASTSRALGHPPPLQTASAPPSNSSTETPKPLATSQATTRKPDLRKGPMVVMVLSAADPFAYESSEKETKKMFHATVATEKQFFHVKVFNIKLKRIFTRRRIITLSDYFEYDHLLEVNEASSVSEAGPDQKIEVPNNIMSRAKETLLIDIIKTQASGTIVYGLCTLRSKIVNKNSTIYEIQDNTGNMEVVGKGKCHDIPCEEGNKLQLFCFRLRKKKQTSKLVSEIHSFIQVMKETNQRIYDFNTLKISKEQSEAPNRSEAGAALIQSHPQTPQMPPAAPSSTFLRKSQHSAGNKFAPEQIPA
ncbi:pyrin and HIN domain-containing protein 1-like [Eulemur rufifrons]|uniref:pyrin and HIN domain-containing protein 1-like n=1 Tax=Eulemur rufifrons TaxID=859984 RepID=UPI0037441533